MKKHPFKHLLTFGLITLMVAGCNNAGKKSQTTTSEGKKATVEAEIFDPVKLKDQIIDIVQKSPSGTELVDMLNQAGASYIIDITIPAENAEKMMTTTTKSLGQGMYAFDTKYAAVYNRGDIALKLNNILSKFITDLGITGDVDVAKKYNDRISKNKENKDSLNVLTTNVINEYNQMMIDSQHPGVYALSAIGGNMEAIYILSQMALYAKDNTKLLLLMSNQNERVKSMAQLLEIMSGDETVRPYFESMKPVIQFFEENKTIGNPELNKIAPEIEKVRNGMIQ
jgi:hypothetical protein